MLAGTIFLYCSTPFILLVLLFNYTDPYPLRFWYNISIEPIYSTAHNINVQHATHAPHTTSLCGHPLSFLLYYLQAQSLIWKHTFQHFVELQQIKQRQRKQQKWTKRVSTSIGTNFIVALSLIFFPSYLDYTWRVSYKRLSGKIDQAKKDDKCKEYIIDQTIRQISRQIVLIFYSHDWCWVNGRYTSIGILIHNPYGVHTMHGCKNVTAMHQQYYENNHYRGYFPNGPFDKSLFEIPYVGSVFH